MPANHIKRCFLITDVCRAGFLPGAVLVISKWYLPNEMQTRIAILYTSASSGGAFSGLLAFAIAKMNGIAGYEGWRWVCFFFSPSAWIPIANTRIRYSS
jgi:hypothetical protein